MLKIPLKIPDMDDQEAIITVLPYYEPPPELSMRDMQPYCPPGYEQLHDYWIDGKGLVPGCYRRKAGVGE